MSQLVRAIVATDTGNRKVIDDASFSPLFVDVFDMKQNVAETYDIKMHAATIYRVGVTLGAKVTVSEFDRLQDESALEMAIERTKRSVIEAVFGEFRQDILQLHNAIYDRDFQKSRALLTTLEKKMFGVE